MAVYRQFYYFRFYLEITYNN